MTPFSSQLPLTIKAVESFDEFMVLESAGVVIATVGSIVSLNKLIVELVLVFPEPSSIVAIKSIEPSAIPVESIVPLKFVPSQEKPNGDEAAMVFTVIVIVAAGSSHVPLTANVVESVEELTNVAVNGEIISMVGTVASFMTVFVVLVVVLPAESWIIAVKAFAPDINKVVSIVPEKFAPSHIKPA